MYPRCPMRSPKKPMKTVTIQAHAYTGTDKRFAAVAWKPSCSKGRSMMYYRVGAELKIICTWFIMVGVNREKANNGPSLREGEGLAHLDVTHFLLTYNPMYIATKNKTSMKNGTGIEETTYWQPKFSNHSNFAKRI